METAITVLIYVIAAFLGVSVLISLGVFLLWLIAIWAATRN